MNSKFRLCNLDSNEVESESANYSQPVPLMGKKGKEKKSLSILAVILVRIRYDLLCIV